MRRSLALRIGTLLLVVFTTTAPAFASRREDSPISPIDRAISRIMQQIHRILQPLDGINLPKP